MLQNRTQERGNVFIFILMGIVLFAALSYVTARGMRSDTTSSLSDRQIELAASDILNYAQQVERVVNRLRRNGCSINDISFFISGVTNAAYEHSPTAPTTCNVFHGNGGGIGYRAPDASWLDGVGGVLTGRDNFNFTTQGVETLGNAGEDIIMYIPNLNEQVCIAINDRANVGSAGATPASDTFGFGYYNGTFGSTNQIGDSGTIFEGERIGCTTNTGGRFHFYYVLYEQ